MTEVEPLALLAADPEPGLALPSELRRVYGGDLALPETCLYANFVQTVDGVVAIPSIPDSNRLVSGDSAADRFVMGLLRAAADVVLIGSGTLRASARGRWRAETVFPAAADAYAELRRELGLEPSPRVAILTASGSIPPDRAVLEDAPIVLTTRAGAGRLAGTLDGGVELVALPGEQAVDVASAVELLYERGLFVEPRLELDGAADRLTGRREDGKRLVSADFDDLAAVGLHVVRDEVDELRGQPRGRLGAELVRVPRVAADVGDQERVYARFAGHGSQVWTPRPAIFVRKTELRVSEPRTAGRGGFPASAPTARAGAVRAREAARHPRRARTPPTANAPRGAAKP